jgi:hypothetical protein
MFRKMKPTHTYILEPYRSPASRHRCPSCGESRKFTRYINTQTRECLADHVGRCNREQNCSYHYTPKQYFLDHPENDIFCQAERSRSPVTISVVKAQIPKSSNPQINTLSHCHIATLSHSLIPGSIFQQSLSNYSHNHLITWLSTHFDQATITKLVNTYLIGTSKNWPGSTVFWQIDCLGNIRDGKIMLYDPITGRRVKRPYNHITWAHSALKLKDYNLRQCFFGEHLLKLHPKLPVSIVESEKTAIIASVYFPQFIWLATGGKHGCKWTTPHVFNVLKARHITLWPDIQAYEDWKIKAQELSKSGLQVTISNLIEQVATESEREAGLDIADYLIRFKPEQFIVFPSVTSHIHLKDDIAKAPREAIPSVIAKAQPEAISSLYHQFLLEQHPLSFLQREGAGGEFWPLDALESFFSSFQLPPTPFRLNQCTIILDLQKFISCHLSILHIYNGNPTFINYFYRLKALKNVIEVKPLYQ